MLRRPKLWLFGWCVLVVALVIVPPIVIQSSSIKEESKFGSFVKNAIRGFEQHVVAEGNDDASSTKEGIRIFDGDGASSVVALNFLISSSHPLSSSSTSKPPPPHSFQMLWEEEDSKTTKRTTNREKQQQRREDFQRYFPPSTAFTTSDETFTFTIYENDDETSLFLTTDGGRDEDDQTRHVSVRSLQQQQQRQSSTSPCTIEPWSSAVPINFDPQGLVGINTIEIVFDTVSIDSQPFVMSPNNLAGCTDPPGSSPTRYYTFTLTQPTVIGITTCSPNTEFDTLLTLFRQSRLDDEGCNIQCLGQNDDHDIGNGPLICQPSKDHSFIITPSLPPDIYFIAVSGRPGGTDDDEETFGSFELILQALEDLNPPPGEAPPPPPVDSSCVLDGAIEIPYDPQGVLAIGSTIGGIPLLPDIKDCSENVGSPTIWYKFTTSVDTTLVLTTCSIYTDFDTYIHVFRGVPEEEGACSVQCVGSNKNHGLSSTDVELCSSSELHSAIFFANDGTANTYYVAISGTSPVQSGNYELLLLTLSNEDGELPTIDDDDDDDTPEPIGVPPTPAPITPSPNIVVVTPSPITTPSPVATPSPVMVMSPVPIAVPEGEEEECGELFDSCQTNEDCCDGGICVVRLLGPPAIKVCSSQFVRARAKQSVGGTDRGGQAGRAKTGGTAS